MRLAIVTWSRRKVGGVETYLDSVVSELAKRDHDVALWCEIDRPADREHIRIPEGAPAWCVEDLGQSAALKRLREWQPDIIFAHGLRDARLEPTIPRIAPAVLFAHQYHGTCVGGAKTWKNPTPTPCARRFGLACLVHYYPHRCGGWHPGTMVREYLNQRRRLDSLREYKGIVTHSEHMRSEYLKHRFPLEFVHKLPFPVAEAGPGETANLPDKNRKNPPSRLLFIGRMDPLKGGRILFDAVQKAADTLGRPLHLTLAGDGPARADWDQIVREFPVHEQKVEFDFVGWVEGSERNRHLAQADLLVMPSLWPEPFGMVGLEAGLFGVPSAAFAVGGIPDWLRDGENGLLAPGNPPTVTGLAGAIRKCLGEPGRYATLCKGARRVAREFSLAAHVSPLLDLFCEIADAP